MNAVRLPTRVYLDLTYTCPLKCKHCYSCSEPDYDSKNELSIKEIEHLLHQIRSLGVAHLIVSGGEPFARKDISELLDLFGIQPFIVSILTNGLLIDSCAINKLKKDGLIIRIGIDGITETTHDYVRGSGNFRAALDTFRMLKSAGIRNRSVHITINKMNICEILKIPLFLNEIGIKDAVISTIKPIGRVINYPELLIEPSLLPIIKHRIYLINYNRNIDFHIYNLRNWTGLGCPAGHTKCSISADGRISPCVFLGEEYLGGNIRDKELIDLWNHDENMTSIRNLPSGTECSTCGYFSLGNGGCRARALYYGHSITGMDPYCCVIKTLQSNSVFSQKGGIKNSIMDRDCN